MAEFWNAVLDDLRALREHPSAFVLARRLWTDPSFATLFRWRLSCDLRKKGLLFRVASKLLWKRNVRLSGCFLSAKATIGPGLVLPHATGIVVGDGAVIGRNVTIYQNVTLGRRTEADEAYPTVSDSVCLYAGACVVGGCTIGRESVVAANAVVASDVLPFDVVGGIPARPLTSRSSFERARSVKREVHDSSCG